MEKLPLTRISAAEMALSLKNGKEGKCLPQNIKKIKKFYGRISKRMQLNAPFWNSPKMCKIQHFCLIPLAFSIKIDLLTCFISISGQPKIKTGQMSEDTVLNSCY